MSKRNQMAADMGAAAIHMEILAHGPLAAHKDAVIALAERLRAADAHVEATLKRARRHTAKSDWNEGWKAGVRAMVFPATPTERRE